MSRSRLFAVLTLGLLAIPTVSTAPLVSLVAAAVVLLVVAVLDARRAWGLPPEQVMSPY